MTSTIDQRTMATPTSEALVARATELVPGIRARATETEQLRHSPSNRGRSESRRLARTLRRNATAVTTRTPAPSPTSCANSAAPALPPAGARVPG